MTEEMAQEHGAKIYTYGSYRLGVNPPDADIDTLCIAPRNIDRSRDVFGMPDPSTQKVSPPENILVEVLKRRPEATKIVPVPDSYVPVLKFCFDGVEIDLICACLQMTTIPEKLDITDDKVLRNLNDSTQRSVNGIRVTDSILRLVPNIEHFRMTLRVIKLWAQNRAIYSNKIGYIGGVQCAVLTARICQLYPNGVPAFLVSRFFRVYSEWKWPTPLLLTSISQGKPNLGFTVWNPYGQYSRELMPIITPAYPSMNASFNVSLSTLNVMKEEILRGKMIVDLIFERAERGDGDNKKNADGTAEDASWDLLLAKSEFFSDYRNLLQVDVFADSPSAFEKWSGWVESRLRHLVLRLETCPDVQKVRPYPYGLKGNPEKPAGQCITFFFGLKFVGAEKGAKKQVDIGRPVQDWKVNAVEIFRERTLGMELNMTHVKNLNLPEFVTSQVPPIMKRKKKKKKKRVRPTSLDEGVPEAKRRESTESLGKRDRTAEDGIENEGMKKQKLESNEANGVAKANEENKGADDGAKGEDGAKQPFETTVANGIEASDRENGKENGDDTGGASFAEQLRKAAAEKEVRHVVDDEIGPDTAGDTRIAVSAL